MLIVLGGKILYQSMLIFLMPLYTTISVIGLCVDFLSLAGYCRKNVGILFFSNFCLQLVVMTTYFGMFIKSLIDPASNTQINFDPTFFVTCWI